MLRDLLSKNNEVYVVIAKRGSLGQT